jgi:hypothetical protein
VAAVALDAGADGAVPTDTGAAGAGAVVATVVEGVVAGASLEPAAGLPDAAGGGVAGFSADWARATGASARHQASAAAHANEARAARNAAARASTPSRSGRGGRPRVARLRRNRPWASRMQCNPLTVSKGVPNVLRVHDGYRRREWRA